MNTELRKFTVRDICAGFVYNELEGRGLYGLNGKLVIQPEYQRNYIYKDANKEALVIDSVLRGYPLGLIYFNKVGEDMYEVLDGQQRITSLGRFLTGKFSVYYTSDMPQYYYSLPEDLKEKILDTELLVYVCDGTESEIKEWFKTINIAGIPLKPQEILNAVYSGPFVTLAKSVFSNSQNSNMQMWSSYVKGDPRRQEILEVALDWVSHGDIAGYMSRHRHDTDITELRTYFDTVIDWVSSVFLNTDKYMCGLDWDRLYEEYHTNAYDPERLAQQVDELLRDEFVTHKAGIWEYVLGMCRDVSLLNVRLFDDRTKRAAYGRQTEEARASGKSNCPLCALGNSTKIWALNQMDADHVTAWSNGGSTDISNCQMLCKTHNRVKGNR